MKLKKWTSSTKKYKLKKGNGGIDMAVLTQSISQPFIVDKDKNEDFFNRKKNNEVLKKIFKKAKRLEQNIIK